MHVLLALRFYVLRFIKHVLGRRVLEEIVATSLLGVYAGMNAVAADMEKSEI